MDKLDLFTLIREITLAVTGVPSCILGNQNEDAPDGEYCAIHVDSGRRQRGQANIVNKDVGPVSSPIGNVLNVGFEIKSQIVAEVTLNFYRGDANLFASRIFQANKLPSIQLLLWNAKVGWQGSGPVNDLTALQSSQQEPRAQIKIRLLYEQLLEETVNSIYGVLTEVEDEDGNTLVSDFIQAPTEP